MKIQWNNVRWYSKLLAMIVFVGTFVLAIWLGMSYTPNNSEKAVDTNVSEETSIPETVIDKEELSKQKPFRYRCVSFGRSQQLSAKPRSSERG